MSQKKQIKIGITGGIGSGKTFVSSIFSKLKIPVFNADVESKKHLNENKSLKQKIQHLFGDMVYNDGVLQNKVLADIVFNNSHKLEELNKLVHPLVKRSFNNWCINQTSNMIIKETAILFESDSHLDLDKVICVSAPKATRIERVIKRDSISRDQVLARIKMQMPQNEKEKLSDFIIVNNEVKLLLPQIIKVVKQIS